MDNIIGICIIYIVCSENLYKKSHILIFALSYFNPKHNILSAYQQHYK